ncbi:chryseobasin maturation helper ChrI [Chryseobacterium daeguense]|uniref:chryseobasin maturation helper ChrI n=1 Tax=Chryseobacterium daeguense TaxID=412438 RepID=UPI00041E6A9C|nr:anthrone oxygenase family protein [Chryseobacterium daeguense]
MKILLLIVTATVTALIAGLFYAYSCSVVLGLSKLSDTEYLKSMQSINREILNPVFFISFMGTAVLLPASTIFYRSQNPVFIFLLLATLAYLIGVFGLTIFGNVPLNDQLDKFDIMNSTPEAIKEMRDRFENSWNFFNNIRTVFSLITIILTICACVFNKTE